MNDLSIYEKIPPLDKHFPVKVIPENTIQNLHIHWHEHIELLFFEENDFIITCGGNVYNANKGDMIVVNSNEVHSFTTKNPCAIHTCIIMYPDFFKDVSFEGIILKNLIPQDKFIGECFSYISEKHKNPEVSGDMLIKSKAYEMMAYLVKNYARECLSKSEYDKRRARLKKINDILNYIEEHYHENISTSTLSNEFFLSESYICRLLKKETGITPVEYINNFRIEKAKVLLKNTDESITSLAMNLGFSDLNYFSRIFKKATEFTPREYRKKP